MDPVAHANESKKYPREIDIDTDGGEEERPALDQFQDSFIMLFKNKSKENLALKHDSLDLKTEGNSESIIAETQIGMVDRSRSGAFNLYDSDPIESLSSICTPGTGQISNIRDH